MYSWDWHRLSAGFPHRKLPWRRTGSADSSTQPACMASKWHRHKVMPLPAPKAWIPTSQGMRPAGNRQGREVTSSALFKRIKRTKRILFKKDTNYELVLTCGRSFRQFHTLHRHWPVAAAPTLCPSGYGKRIFKKTLIDIRQLHLSDKEHKITN